MHDSIKLRYRIFPYIYNAARIAYENGICIIRPLYYEWPKEENAYTNNS